MIHYSVLVPVRDSTTALGRLLPDLCNLLADLALPFEIIAIDDASGEAAGNALEDLLSDCAALRLLRFGRPRGTSAALCAGIAAARGEIVIAIDPAGRLPLSYLPNLIARLSPANLVLGRVQPSLPAQLLNRVAQVWRIVRGDGRLHADEELFWVAHRAAVAKVALTRGSFRLLAALVARRQGQVCHVVWAEGRPPQGFSYTPGVGDHLMAGSIERRFEPHLASEWARGAIMDDEQVPMSERQERFRPTRHALRGAGQPHVPSHRPAERESEETAS